MFRNVYYNTKTSKIYLWETDEDGNRKQEIIDWVPYVYVPDNNGTIESIFGDKVSKKEFNSYKEYKEFECKNVFENNVVPSIQFLAEKYHSVPDEEFKSPELKIYSFDIECYVPRGEGFPNSLEAKHPITAISVYDFTENQSYTFGDQEYTGSNKYNTIYVNCGNEANLLKKFFEWWECNCPDLITGWNTISDTKMNPNGGFDFPYIINRCKHLFGEKTKLYKKFSPINIVNCYISKNGSFNLNIAGVTIIDYMSLYKWYSFDNVPSYSLQYICEKELGIGKLGDGSYDLRDLYLTDYNEYIDYNVVDNLRIKELEDKLGFLKLAQSLCLLCKCPMNMYNTSTSLIEGLLLTRYRRTGLCAPRFVGGQQESFEAAFVKKPQKGLHKWIFSVDITSSYPFGIITLNMSPETLYGKILGIKDEVIVKYMRKKEFPEFRLMSNTGIIEFKGKKLKSFNKALQRKLFSVAPSGAVFINGKHGVYSDMEREVFSKRKQVKKEMKKLKKQVLLMEDGEEKKALEEKSQRFHVLQWALKIVVNSAFGVLAVPYSRYFNLPIAEAIPAVGRESIKSGVRYINDLMNHPNQDMLDIFSEINGCKTKSLERKIVDSVLYVDTDSCYVSFDMYIGNYINKDKWEGLSDEKKIEYVEKLASIVESDLNYRTFNETQMIEYNSIEEDFKIEYKQEKIAKSGLWIAKKKYAVYAVSDEGVRKEKISVTGLDMIRGECPIYFREHLNKVLEMILKGYSDSDIKKYVNNCKKEANNLSPDDIATNVGVKNIKKYIDSNFEYKKGTPYHVKGVANYWKLTKKLNIFDKYPQIEEGAKNKVLYVKNNPFGMETITYQKWPTEFEQIGIIPDNQKQIDKYFINKIEMLLKPMNKEHILKTNNNFNVFF